MKSSALNLLVLSLFCLSASSSLVSKEPRRNCVLDADGKMNCVVLSPVSPVVRMGARAPCAREDVMCWCKKAKDYTNDVRKKNGVRKMLKLGTESQMDNAMKYAKKLSAMGFLKHQDLSKVTKEVGCQRWMGGENLAFNYETGDIAKMCVNQWVGSQGHFENLVRDWFEEVVIGFHFDRDGRVYCVQTFALPYPRGTYGSPTDKGCQLLGRSAGTATRAPTTRAPTTRAPTTRAPTTRAPTTRAPTTRAPTTRAPTTRAPTTRAPTTRAPTTQAPTTPRTVQAPVTSAPPSCKCIRYGKGCRMSVAQEAGNGCRGRTQRSKQARSCKIDCCDFCKVYPDVGECHHRHVIRICGKL